MNEWKNYGDVNPVEYGGTWIKKDNENCFLVVRSIPIEEDGYLFEDLYVDISSSWIDWNFVNELSDGDINDGPIEKVLKLIDCYSNLEFGTEKIIKNEEDLINELKKYDIFVKGK